MAHSAIQKRLATVQRVCQRAACGASIHNCVFSLKKVCSIGFQGIRRATRSIEITVLHSAQASNVSSTPSPERDLQRRRARSHGDLQVSCLELRLSTIGSRTHRRRSARASSSRRGIPDPRRPLSPVRVAIHGWCRSLPGLKGTIRTNAAANAIVTGRRSRSITIALLSVTQTVPTCYS